MANPGSSGLSDISSALSQLFPKLQRNANRMSVLLESIPTEKGMGKNVSFDAELDGAKAGSRAEGADFVSTDFAVDGILPATLPWAEYGSAFQITHQAIDASASSVGVDGSMSNQFGNRLMSSVGKIVSVQNGDSWNGTGTDGSGNQNIIGILGGMLDTTTAYGGISASGNPLWRANVNASVGSLTVAKLAQMESNIYAACGVHPNVIWASDDVFALYSNLFEVNRRIVGSGPDLVYNTSTTSLRFQDIAVLRDKDGYTGTLVMGHTDYIGKRFLPPAINQSALSSTLIQVVIGAGDNGDTVKNPIGVPFRLDHLAKSGTSYKFALTGSMQLVCTRRNAFGVMSGITA